jgi:hypothetical protein
VNLTWNLPSDVVRPVPEEIRAPRPGDDIVPSPDVVMDRAFTVDAPIDAVWPWIVQLGKRRGGWYLPRTLERLVPPRRRALRVVDPSLQGLKVGDVIPDWGGRDATFTVRQLRAPSALVHYSRRGRVELSWAITLSSPDAARTRIHVRLRMAPIKRRRAAMVLGGAVDLLSIAVLAAGLRERVRHPD